MDQSSPGDYLCAARQAALHNWKLRKSDHPFTWPIESKLQFSNRGRVHAPERSFQAII
jgi:hypothetical protein